MEGGGEQMQEQQKMFNLSLNWSHTIGFISEHQTRGQSTKKNIGWTVQMTCATLIQLCNHPQKNLIRSWKAKLYCIYNSKLYHSLLNAFLEWADGLAQVLLLYINLSLWATEEERESP